MATVFTNATKQIFADLVINRSQQQGSKLYNKISHYPEPVKDMAWTTELSPSHAGLRGSGNQASPKNDLAFKRRKLTTTAYAWGTLLDRDSTTKLVEDPTGKVVKNASKAMARAIDGVICRDMHSAVTLFDASTSALPSTSIIGTGAANITVADIFTAREKLEQADVDFSSESVNIGITSFEKKILMYTTEFKSWDVAGKQRLNTGEIDGFLGFNFIQMDGNWSQDYGTNVYPIIPVYEATETTLQTTALVGTGDIRYLPIWVEDAVEYGHNDEMMVEMEKDPANSFGVQIYLENDFGSVRVDDARVLNLKVSVV